MNDSRLFPMAILITLLALSAHYWLSRAPEVKPDSAPATEFSAARAIGLLDHLLRENEPHPLGSAANQRVKNRIVQWLDDTGIENEIQPAWGCATRHNSCGWVENIIARIPGTDPQGAHVALMAHYDSVPMAPGAGDDGAGVVAVLETARALLAHGPLPNPVLLLITDGEEAGLLGAEAFFRFHPLADEIGVILNVEGSGTTGPSQVLRTAMGNATFMGHYGEGADYPFGASLANEVFKRMPNDTDFSVSMRSDIPGIDFSFADERNHYHTPNDSVANLDPRTVQHHGENLLPTALRLASEDLGRMETGSVVYAGLFGAWFQWPVDMTKWLWLLSAALLAGAAWRPPGSYRKLAVAATLVPLAMLVCSSLVAFLAFRLLDVLNGTTVSWPAHLWPFRVVLFSSMLTAMVAIAAFVNRRIPLFVVLLGGWVFWWLLSLVLVVMIADAANVLLIPLLPAAVLLFISARLPLPENGRKAAWLLTLVAVAPMLAMAMLLEATQGYRLVFSTFAFIALFGIAFGAFVRGSLVRPALWTGMGLLVVGMNAATTLPLYSDWRPQHVNIDYVENANEPQAYWRLRSDGPPPASITTQAEFTEPERSMYPWTTDTSRYLALAGNASLPAPELEVLSVETLDEGRRVHLRLRSNRAARFIQLVLPAESTPVLYRIGGNEVTPLPSRGEADTGVYRLVFLGTQSREVELSIDFADSDPVNAYLLDTTTELPPGAALMLTARPPLASPVHSGDMALVFRQVGF